MRINLASGNIGGFVLLLDATSNNPYLDFMIDDPRNKPPPRKNPTFAISILIVVVVLLVIGTLFFNAIREKREYDSQNVQSPASSAALAAPSTGASQ